MRIIISAKNLELNNILEDFIDERIGGLKKYVDVLKEESEKGKTLAEVFVEIEKETKHHRKGDLFIAKAQIQLPGKKLIMAEARADNLSKAAIQLRNELKKEIEKYKSKITELSRRKQKKVKNSIFKI